MIHPGVKGPPRSRANLPRGKNLLKHEIQRSACGEMRANVAPIFKRREEGKQNNGGNPVVETKVLGGETCWKKKKKSGSGESTGVRRRSQVASPRGWSAGPLRKGYISRLARGRCGSRNGAGEGHLAGLRKGGRKWVSAWAGRTWRDDTGGFISREKQIGEDSAHKGGLD